MSSLEFTALIFVGSLLAGFLGALTGLGGGVVVVPLLAVVFRVDIHYAIGAALVSVIATSSGAAAAYVREGYSNIRVGMFLEMATTMGALAGAALVLYLRASVIAGIFGFVLVYSSLPSFHPGSPLRHDLGPDRIAAWLGMDSTYPPSTGFASYHVPGVPIGFLLMLVAAVFAGPLRSGPSSVEAPALGKPVKVPVTVSR